MHIPAGILFMWDDVPCFQNIVSVVVQKTRFWHSKNRKCTFRGKKWKIASIAFLAVLRGTHVSDMGLFKYFNFLSFLVFLKFCQKMNL
jgi:hypothetical protein